MVATSRASVPAVAPAPRRERVLRGSFVNKVADALTITGVALTPLYGKGVGGITGIAYADIVLAFATLARGLQWFTEGIPMAGIRRQSVLLGLLGLLGLAGIISGFASGTPLSGEYLRIMLATAGTVLLVASFGGGGVQRSYRPLILAFAGGCVVLGLSVFVGPSIQGRAFGWAIHPNQLGHSCMMGCGASMWLLDNTRDNRARAFWAFATLLNIFAVMQSGSRGGLLGFGVAAAAYLALRGSPGRRLVALAGVWAVVLVLATGIVTLPESNPIQRFITESQVETGSNAARKELLQLDITRINAEPVFGYGFQDILNVHMVYFQGWIGAGALGLLAIVGLGLAMLALPLVQWNRPRDLALACGASSIAIAWTFTNILTLRDQWVYLAIAFGTAPPLVTGRFAPGRPLPAPAPAT